MSPSHKIAVIETLHQRIGSHLWQIVEDLTQSLVQFARGKSHFLLLLPPLRGEWQEELRDSCLHVLVAEVLNEKWTAKGFAMEIAQVSWIGLLWESRETKDSFTAEKLSRIVGKMVGAGGEERPFIFYPMDDGMWKDGAARVKRDRYVVGDEAAIKKVMGAKELKSCKVRAGLLFEEVSCQVLGQGKINSISLLLKFLTYSCSIRNP
jgi:hypothetical protein